MSKISLGQCDKCRSEFNYSLIHNGFNETSYAYCDSCGKTCFLGEYFQEIPEQCKWFFESQQRYEKISEKLEPYLEKCSCGGNFRRSAIPRCPKCKQKLDPIEINKFIDVDKPDEYKGKNLWQNNWDGIYAIVIENNRIRDNWKRSSLGLSFKEKVKLIFKRF